MRRHSPERRHEDVEEQRRRSEQGEIHHAELRLARAQRPGIAGRQRVHGGQDQHHEKNEITRDIRRDRPQYRRHAESLANRQTEEGEQGKAGGHEAHAGVMAMLLRDEFIQREGLIGFESRAKKREHSCVEAAEQIDAQT